MIKQVDCKTLKTWMDKGEAVLVDVREPAEHASEAIPGAVLLPMGQLAPETLPPLSGKKLVVHCRKGGRGGRACEQLASAQLGCEVYNLEGGIDGWAAAGLPITSGNKKMLPLDRQTQVAVGTLVLLASLLGYYASPAFFLLGMFFGGGLIFAGISGFCGMALLIARAPWNQSPQKNAPGNAEGAFCSMKKAS